MRMSAWCKHVVTSVLFHPDGCAGGTSKGVQRGNRHRAGAVGMPGRTFEGPPVHQPSNGADPAPGSQRQWPETPAARKVQGDAVGGEIQHQIGHFRTNGIEAALKPAKGPRGGLRQGERTGRDNSRVGSAWQQPEHRAQQGQRIVATDPTGTRRAVHPTDPDADHVSPVDPDGPGVAEAERGTRLGREARRVREHIAPEQPRAAAGASSRMASDQAGGVRIQQP